MRKNAQRDIFKTLINNRLGATAICNIVEKVSLGDTVWGNYSYLANGTKVSALDNRGKNPYAVMIVTNRNGSTIYKTVVRVTGRHRDRSASRGDTPVGKSRILEWRKTGNSRYSADSYGPNDLLALEYYEGEGIGRFGMHLHGGRSQSPDLKDTEGCIRISDEDIAELKVLTEELEASDPDEKKGTATVENDLPEPVKYSDREDVKYDWERYLGELEASFIIG